MKLGNEFKQENSSLPTYIKQDNVPCWRMELTSWVTTSDAGLPINNETWTTSIWIKADNSSLPTNTDVFGYGNGDINGGYNGMTFTGKNFINSGGFGNNLTYKNDDNIPLNKWNHILHTYDGTNCYIYINGILKKSGKLTKNISLLGSNGLFIGGNHWSPDRFSGYLAGARIYNRQLNETEILTLSQEFNPSDR